MVPLRLLRVMSRLTAFRYYSKNNCPKVHPDILEEMEAGFQVLCESDSKSLVKKHLTRKVFDALKEKTTPSYNSTLLDCIRTGICNLDSGVGIYAPDPEAYCTFADLFDPIIEDYHSGFKRTEKHPPSCFGYGSDFPDLDPEHRYIVSTRVRCGRSLNNYPFNPRMKKNDYIELECRITRALKRLCGEHSGKYLSLCKMDKRLQRKLVKKHYLFKEGDRFLQSAHALRFWPTGRGIFMNRSRTFVVWVNEEDHIRVISMEYGGDLGRAYERMIVGVESLAYQLKFCHDPRLGNLSFCPTNLGTSLRASVHIKLPTLCADKAKLKELTDKYNLQVRGTSGEHSETVGGVLDISNKRRLGLTEYEAITEMYNGIQALIDHECAECAKNPEGSKPEEKKPEAKKPEPKKPEPKAKKECVDTSTTKKK